MLAVLGLGIRLLADDGSAMPGAEISSVTEDSKFWVEVLVEDQRSNPATQQGVISLPVNFSWNPNRIELVSAPVTGTIDPADRLVTLQFPLNRFLQSFDASAGYASDPNSDMITVTANPNMGGLRGASLPNAMEGTAIGKTSGDEFSLLHFQALPGATADNTPFTMQVAGSMSFADADLLNGVNTLINTNRLSRNNFSPLEDQEQLAVTEFIGINATPSSGTISWQKRDTSGNLVSTAGATFTIAPNPILGGTGTYTVVDNGTNDTDPVIGQITVANIVFGTYTINETIAPPGYSLDSTTRTVTVSAATPSPMLSPDFHDALLSPSSLSGFVYADTNFNGVLDRDASGQATEFGLPNVTISLSGTQSQVTTTGADGAYHFENVAAGNYNLIETLPAHYVHTSVISPFGNSVGMILPDAGVTLPSNLSLGTPGPSQISSITLPSGAEGVDYNFGLNAIPDKRFFLASTDIRLLLAGQLGVTAVTVDGTADTPLTVNADSSQLTVTGTTVGTQQFPLSAIHEVIINANGANVALNGTAEGEVADLSPGGGALRVGKDYTGPHFAVFALGTQSVTANGTTGNDLAVLRDTPQSDTFVAAAMATLASADGRQALVAGFDSLDTIRAISLDDNDTATVQAHNYALKLVGKWM
jgi:hypothetical protein